MRILIAVLIMILLAGCAESVMSCKKINEDGTWNEYKVTVRLFGQDFKGSDLAASLDPEGKTTVNAGAVDSTLSPVTADVAASMVELVKAMLPYIAPESVLVEPITP